MSDDTSDDFDQVKDSFTSEGSTVEPEEVEKASFVEYGIEYFLPAMIHEGVNKNRLGIKRIVEVCAENNAKRWGLYPRKGALAVGSDADMVVVDLKKSRVVDEEFSHTMEPGHSTFHGQELTGLPTHTIVGGRVVVENDELRAEPGGRTYLPRGENGVPMREPE